MGRRPQCESVIASANRPSTYRRVGSFGGGGEQRVNCAKFFPLEAERTISKN